MVLSHISAKEIAKVFQPRHYCGLQQHLLKQPLMPLQAETLATLLANTQLGATITQLAGPSGFGLLACVLMMPTVLLPDLNALSVLGALGVMAAATVGFAVSLCYVDRRGYVSLTGGVCDDMEQQAVGASSTDMLAHGAVFVCAGRICVYVFAIGVDLAFQASEQAS